MKGFTYMKYKIDSIVEKVVDWLIKTGICVEVDA